MATPFTLSGTLSLPPDQGEPIVAIPFRGSGFFESKVDLELKLAGSGTRDVDLGTIGAPGAKALVIEVDPSATAAPVGVRINGAGAPGELEVSPGGFLVYSNPAPQAGVTGLTLVHATEVRVRIRVLG
jgi:hypothetical protein